MPIGFSTNSYLTGHCMSDIKMVQRDLAAGQASLKTAAWTEAKTHFEKVLAQTELPEAHDGLGLALWWLNEIHAAHHHRTLAYTGFKERGETGRAARIACWLAREQVFLNANVPAMHGWFARAERLIEQLDSALERAWFLILRASMLDDPHQLGRLAVDIMAAARQLGDSHLEAFTLAFYGQALVTTGQAAQGMACLDEAMTMATSGEVADFTIISEIFCVMLSTCEVAGDLARSDYWCQQAAAFAQRYSCPFLSAYCRTAYGSLMTALGRWQEAETALLEAVRAFENGHRGLRVHAVIRLADLRAFQGKIEEAEVMLAGLEDHNMASIPMARLYLLKGEPRYARATLEHVLPAPSSYTLSHLPLLVLLVDVLLALNDAEAAHQLITHLTRLAQQANSSFLKAQVAFITGRVNFHTGDFITAKVNFDAALTALQFYEQSLLAGQVRLRMAQILQASDPIGAVVWAKGARATFERIGAVHEMAEAASLLRELGVGGLPARLQKPLTQRETEIIELVAKGLSNREIADRLIISAKTVEHHVSHILDKLNLRSRAEAAAFAASGKLSGLDDKTS
jgi:ATP/maltotriose-dependent transcriptional regulator MalT